MTVALSCQKLSSWIENAIKGFRSDDLLGVPEPWLRIYEALADYISSGTPADQKLTWMIEGTDDSLADVIYQLQRLKSALVKEILAEDATVELNQVLAWFDRTIVTLIEKASGKISEERSLTMPYETIFWKARDGMYISTIDGKFLHCNQALMNLLKYDSMQDLLTLDIQSELYVDRPKRQIMVDHLVKDGFFDHHEFKFRCRDGEVKIAMESCYLVDVPNGKQFIVGLLVDVTGEKEIARKTEQYVRKIETKRMEAHFSLRQVARRFDALKKVNDHPFVMIDPKDFRFLNYNPAFTRRFKYAKKNIDGVTFRNLFGRNDWMEIFSQISNATNRMQFHIPHVTCITYDDATFPADLSIAIHQDDLGSALFVQIEDRSELLQLESQVAQLQDNQDNVLENAPIGIIGFKNDGCVAFVNKFFSEKMEYPAYQLKNLAFVNRLFSRDEYRFKFNKYIRRFLRGQHVENATVELRNKSGRSLRFQLNTLAFRFEDSMETGFLALLKEVTESAEGVAGSEPTNLEQEYRIQGEKLAKLTKFHNELKNKALFRQEFLKVLAKKFKVPIHVVLGFASLLKKDLSDKLNESQREDLSIIANHIGFVLNMLEKAVEFTQLEDGEIQYLPDVFFVRSMLDDLFKKLLPKKLPSQKSFTAEHQILSVDLKITCDLQLLESMLRHVVDNAIIYTEQGQIELSAYEDELGLWIEVRDTGQGIGPTEVERVFDPFFQVTNGDPDKRGLGLGLSIAKKYAELMGGEIEIHSRLNVGTRVLVFLGKPVSE